MSSRLEFLRANVAQTEPSLLESSFIVTASMREVARIVTRLASSKQPMPNNPILGDLADGRGRSSVLRALRRLVVANIITIERQGSERRCTVVASGHTTDWGEARPGHSPYLHRRPGDPAPEKPARRERRPQSRPLLQTLPGVGAPLPVSAADRASVAIARACLCQFPLWDDGARVGFYVAPRFCSEPVSTVQGRSYCDFHDLVCYRARPAGRKMLDKRDFQTAKP